MFRLSCSNTSLYLFNEKKEPTKTWSPVSSSSSSASSSPSSISYLLPTYSFASPRSNNSNSFGGYYRSNSQIKTTNTVRTTPNSPRTAAYQPRYDV